MVFSCFNANMPQQLEVSNALRPKNSQIGDTILTMTCVTWMKGQKLVPTWTALGITIRVGEEAANVEGATSLYRFAEAVYRPN